MNYVPNQNEKVLEELAGFNTDDVKTTFEMSTLFQNDPLSFASFSNISPHRVLVIGSITNRSVG